MRRSFRLPRGKELELVFRRGRRFYNSLFQVALRQNDLSHSRFVLVVPRSADKRAVVRNRLRRRIREYVRTRPAFLSQPLDAAITCKKEAARASRAEFYEALEEILTRVFRS